MERPVSGPSDKAIASCKELKARLAFLNEQEESYFEEKKGYGKIWKYELIYNTESWLRAYLRTWPCLYDDTCQN